MSNKLLRDRLVEHARLFDTMAADEHLIDTIQIAASTIFDAFQDGRKVMVCGNGGSSCDSAHVTAEFMNRLTLKREYPLPCIDLSSSNSILTAISNDYGFEHVFEKQVEAVGKSGDVLISLSTSAQSKNILYAMRKASDIGVYTILLTGLNYTISQSAAIFKAWKFVPDLTIAVPSDSTPLIQEAHIHILHSICYLVDDYLELVGG